MENNNKKGISKRALRTKIILLVILAIIMIPLIILYKSVGDTTPKIKLYNRNQTESSVRWVSRLSMTSSCKKLSE